MKQLILEINKRNYANKTVIIIIEMKILRNKMKKNIVIDE